MGNVLTVEMHAATANDGRRRQQPRGSLGDHGLATTRFPHQRVNATRRDHQIDTAQNRRDAPRLANLDMQIAKLQHRLALRTVRAAFVRRRL